MKSGSRGCTLDNVCLTKQYAVAFENPSFCMGNRAVTVSPGERWLPMEWDFNWPASGVASLEAPSLNADNWGLATWDDSGLVSICGLAGLSQTVNFPVAGTYVATVPCRNRKDNTSCQQVLALNLIRSGVTNTVGKIRVNSLAFQRHRVLFDVPEAGDWRFELKGTLNEYGYALVDCPSIDYVAASRLAKPTVPERLRVDVAEGATLRLDYAGTNKVARYRYAGTRHAGVLTAANCLGLTGTGALEVPRWGIFVIVK